jgi:hypothetical protein
MVSGETHAERSNSMNSRALCGIRPEIGRTDAGLREAHEAGVACPAGSARAALGPDRAGRRARSPACDDEAERA